MAPLLASSSLASLSAEWLPMILDTAAKGSVLLILAGAVAVAFRHASAASRHLVWAAAMVGLLVLPGLLRVLPQWQILPVWFRSPTVAIQQAPIESHAPDHKQANPRPISDQAVLAANADRVSDTHSRDADLGTRHPQLASAAAAGARPRRNGSPVRRSGTSPSTSLFLLFWAAGAVALVMRLVLCRAILTRVARASTRVTAGRVHELLVSLCRQICIGGRVHLLLSDHRAMPMTWGVFRRYLLLPAEAEVWDDERLRAVLLHELAHIKRRDAATRLLVQLSSALHWFNPLVWLAARRMHVESEHASDDFVLAYGTKPSDYAEHLVRVATGYEQQGVAGVCAIGMAKSRSKLEDRVLSVLNANLSRKGLRWALVLCVLVAIALVVPLAMMHGRQKKVQAFLLVRRSADIMVEGPPSKESDRAYEVYKETHKQLIQGPFVLTAALRRPGISQLPLIRKQGGNAVEWLMGELNVITSPETMMITVKMAGDEPQQLVKLVNAVVRAYMEKIVDVERQEQIAMKTTLERELLEKTRHLETIQDSFNMLAKKESFAFPDGMETLALRLAVTELSDLSRKKQKIEDQLSDAKRRYEKTKAAMDADGQNPVEFWIEEELEKDYEYAEAKFMLDQLEEQYRNDQESARPGSAALMRLEQQINLAKKELGRLKSEKEPRIRPRIKRMPGPDEWTADSILRQLQAEITALESELKSLTEEYDRKRQEFGELSKASVELLAKKRELESLEEFIAEAEMRVNTLRINLQEPPRIKVLKEAMVVE